MLNRIYEGTLDMAEYRTLWLKRKNAQRRPLFILLGAYWAAVLILCVLTIVYAPQGEYAAAYVFIVFVGIGEPLLTLWLKDVFYQSRFFFPSGKVKIYQSEDRLYIVSQTRTPDVLLSIRIGKRTVEGDHLLIEESPKNFVYLPKEVDSAILPYGK